MMYERSTEILNDYKKSNNSKFSITIWSMVRDQMCLFVDQMQNERRKYKEEVTTIYRLGDVG